MLGLVLAATVQGHKFGLGRADVTGPTVEIAFVSIKLRILDHCELYNNLFNEIYILPLVQ